MWLERAAFFCILQVVNAFHRPKSKYGQNPPTSTCLTPNQLFDSVPQALIPPLPSKHRKFNRQPSSHYQHANYHPQCWACGRQCGVVKEGTSSTFVPEDTKRLLRSPSSCSPCGQPWWRLHMLLSCWGLLQCLDAGKNAHEMPRLSSWAGNLSSCTHLCCVVDKHCNTLWTLVEYVQSPDWWTD